MALPHGAFDRTDRSVLTHIEIEALQPDLTCMHMVLMLSVTYPLVTGAMIVMQDHAQHLSTALLDFPLASPAGVR